MDGPARAMAYRTALGTGFRSSELRSLTPESFDLDADPPTITVSAGSSKRRREDVQPIRADLAEQLRGWLQGKPRSKPVFSLSSRTAELIRADLRLARARWIREGLGRNERRERRKAEFLAVADGSGRVADFHGLRHSYITRLVNSGVSVKVAQELARHSDPKLTIGRYAHARLTDLSAALDALPSTGTTCEPAQSLRATGTDDRTPSAARSAGASARGTNHSESVRSSARNVRTGDASRNGQEPRENAGFPAKKDQATDRTRTDNLRFTKPLLCQLSYGGAMRPGGADRTRSASSES